MTRSFGRQIGCWALAAGLASLAPAGRQLDRRIRVGVTAVPVTVSVVDGRGRPVLDLGPGDFEILEEGVRQQITLFSPPSEVHDDRAVRTSAAAGDLVEPRPVPRRFLILVGRVGQDPLNTLEDLAEFVEHDLRPNDQVAVMSWSRATHFTNQFPEAAALIRALAEKKAVFDSLFRQRESLVLFAAGMRAPPASVRREIDPVFDESPLGNRRVVDPLTYSPAEANRLSDRLLDAGFEATEDLQQALDAMGVPEAGILLAEQNRLDLARRIARSDLDVKRYEAQRAATRLDSYQLASAIEYLRYLDGEKYLFFLNSRGLDQSDEERRGLTRRASDARVRLYAFQTGGVAPLEGGLALTTSATVGGRSLLNRDRSTMTALYGGRLSTSLMLGTLEKLAEETGGEAFLRKDIGKSLDRALSTINSNYLLAYTPSNTVYDLAFRRIEVRVKRDGVRVSHRSGYVAMPALSDDERFEGLVLNRLLSAASQQGPQSDVAVRSRLTGKPRPGSDGPFEVEINVRLTSDVFTLEDSLHTTRLVLGYFFTPGRSSRTRSVMDRISLRLTDENYARILEEGLWLTRKLDVPPSTPTGTLKVVAYQPDRDYLGSDQLAFP